MSVQFHPLKVREVRRETPDTVSVAFDVPAQERQAFQFKQGQYLTLKTLIGGEEVRRSYSICTGVHDNDLRVAVKKVDGGVFSTWANEHLKAGDTLEVMPPQGNFFTELDPANEKMYVAFAAGSGITPVMSILRSTLETEPGSRFVLFYGNRSFDYIIFREQLEELKNRYPDRLSVHHVLSRESLGSDLFQGRITGEKCERYGKVFFNPAEVDAFFLCGPEEMVFEVKDTLLRLGANHKSVHFELFNTTAGKSKPAASSVKEAFEASITVIQDGAEFDFKLPSDGSTLLDAAMRAGADLPFSCKGGVCSTCKAKILEGKVEMSVNYGLEPDEVEAGYVLTCQAHPVSKRVVVSFDA
ncbi:MAG: phenylacetate-CoA oxygenase/reductase subunit PaaK [Saprospiraceae bacterium]|nr:phenylacetate-CoA oxygenase/reductase subunit PaaK [Saprospiraceae bacterium]